jgi:hypothetical protein
MLAAGCGGDAGAPGGASTMDERGVPLGANEPAEPGMPRRGASGGAGATGVSRSCSVSPSPEGFTLVSTQAQLDLLAGCEEIRGPLHVDAPDGVQLDLRPLASLRRVAGAVTLGCNPYLGTDSYCGESVERSFTLAGLENLESVGSLTLGGLRLSSLAALRSLRNIGHDLSIVNCNGLESLDGLDGAPVATLSLQQNAQLVSLLGLTLAPVARRVHIQGAPSLTDLSALSSLTSVDHLELREMPLENLDDVGNLSAVGSLYLIDVPRLNDISALNRVSTLDQLYVDGTALQNVDALQLESIEAIYLAHNPALVGVDSLGGLSHLGSIEVLGNDSLARLPVFPDITEMTSVFLQFNAALVEGPGFPSLERMPSGTIAIADNPNLLRIDGFPSLSEVAAVEIRRNAQLVEVAFGQLTSAGSLHITCNPELPSASLAPLMQVSSTDRDLDGNQGSEEACVPL